MGVPVRVVPEAGTPHQDRGSVSLVGTATLAWCAGRGGGDADPRRLRANIVFTSEEPFVEETWIGRAITCGPAVLRVVERAPRCRTVDVEQDDARVDRPWLRLLADERDLCLAVYADVSQAGPVRVGDPVAVT